jgi:hypothetical protein
LEAALVLVEQRIELLSRNLLALLPHSGLKGFSRGEEVKFLGLFNVGVGAEKFVETILTEIRYDRRTIRTWRSCVRIVSGPRFRGVKTCRPGFSRQREDVLKQVGSFSFTWII